MKFTLAWLKDHLDTEQPLAAIAEALTRVGLEVERVADAGAALAPFVVARVLSAEQHPNADRLRVCGVDVGAPEPVQVVCGAPNARAGMLSVFAPPGALIPGKDITLSIGTIRGVESRGMLCSGAELGLSDEADGILDLPEGAPVGAPYAAFAGLDDPVIEVNLTPNRPDCAGVRGIARDLAAAGLGRLKPADPPAVRGDGPCPVPVARDLVPGDAHLCPAFGLRLMRGVTNGPSPAWMQRRLRAIGLRPISALVDVTNYVTFDRGRPLHVFDAAKVRGRLSVRRARAGEVLRGLDGRDHALGEDDVVIADEAGVESLAGVMGGAATGVDENTTEVLIESALWDPLTVARTGRRLGVSTDARYRFERGVDPLLTVPGLDIASALIAAACGGASAGTTLVGEVPESSVVIAYPFAEVRRLTGLDVPAVEQRVILRELGFHVSGEGAQVRVAPPSWRPDVHGKADLVEEVVRIAGLDRVRPTPLPPMARRGAVLTLLQRRTRLAKRALAARGMAEAVTWSFVPERAARAFGGGAPELRLTNPIAADLSDMRPSLLPGLAMAAGRNADRGFHDLVLFEVGQVFRGDRPEDQRVSAAGLRRGRARPEGSGRHWRGAPGAADAFDAKADALALLDALGVPLGGLQVAAPGPEWAHPGRSGSLRFGPRNAIGWFGELHPAALAALGVEGPMVAFEVELDALPVPKAKATRARPRLDLAALQPITRDFAFLVDRSARAEDLERAARAVDRALVTGAEVFDRYEGKGVPEGQVSLALAVTLQPRERSLTEAEIEAVSRRLVEAAGRAVGAVLRG